MSALLRVRHVARILDMPRTTVHLLIRRGVIRALRIPTGHGPNGHVIRIPCREVERLLARAKQAELATAGADAPKA